MIKKLRDRAKLTPSELSQATGVPLPTLQKIETGATPLEKTSTQILVPLAESFNLNPALWLPDQEFGSAELSIRREVRDLQTATLIPREILGQLAVMRDVTYGEGWYRFAIDVFEKLGIPASGDYRLFNSRRLASVWENFDALPFSIAVTFSTFCPNVENMGWADRTFVIPLKASCADSARTVGSLLLFLERIVGELKTVDADVSTGDTGNIGATLRGEWGGHHPEIVTEWTGQIRELLQILATRWANFAQFDVDAVLEEILAFGREELVQAEAQTLMLVDLEQVRLQGKPHSRSYFTAALAIPLF